MKWFDLLRWLGGASERGGTARRSVGQIICARIRAKIIVKRVILLNNENDVLNGT